MTLCYVYSYNVLMSLLPYAYYDRHFMLVNIDQDQMNCDLQILPSRTIKINIDENIIALKLL